MTGLFATQQPRFEAHNIPTFPLIDKKPAVKNWLRAGIPASRAFARKYPDAPQVGFGLKRAGIAVVDIDTPCENTLADALARHGETPIVIRSGSGNHQLWYANNDEGRHIRPDPDKPIDILADGLIIAPPSIAKKGSYAFIEGCLDDVHSLPIMRNPPAQKAVPALPDTKVAETQIFSGERNNLLFRAAMKFAKTAPDFESLLMMSAKHNLVHCQPPLPDNEVAGVAGSAWGYQAAGKNRFGSESRVELSRSEIARLWDSPDAMVLLIKLRQHHWTPAAFPLANAICEVMPNKWARYRLAKARADLVERGFIREVSPATRHWPAHYAMMLPAP
jgi:Bifunctional DNA primase/polymerase, N-terminal/Primase C terminal 1 (PriCT-1)